MYPAPKPLQYSLMLVAVMITTTGEAQYKVRQNLYVDSTPFNQVLVLDNRFDTTKVYTYQTGNYPPQSLIWRNVAYEMERCVTKTLSNVSTGNKTLLVNIEQLRVANRSSGISSRGIMFSACVYCQIENDRYKKIITINLGYPINRDIGDALKPIAIDLVDAATVYTDPSYSAFIEKIQKKHAVSSSNSITKQGKFKEFIQNTEAVQYSHDTATLTLEEINVNARDRWAEYPVIKDSIRHGIYSTFEDFKNNIAAPAAMSFQYNNEDSTYIFIRSGKSRNDAYYESPWAVCDSNGLYIRVYKGRYLKAEKRSSSFYFHVPETLPDMYALLSIEQNGPRGSSTTLGEYNSVAEDLAVSVFAEAIKSTKTALKNKKIAAEGFKHDYRECFIDMSCGDFIYE
jgi:hypothetical protein